MTLPEFEWLLPPDAVPSVGGARPALMKDFGVPADPETSFHALEDRSRTDLAAGPSSGATTVSTANVRGY